MEGKWTATIELTIEGLAIPFVIPVPKRLAEEYQRVKQCEQQGLIDVQRKNELKEWSLYVLRRYWRRRFNRSLGPFLPLDQIEVAEVAQLRKHNNEIQGELFQGEAVLFD